MAKNSCNYFTVHPGLLIGIPSGLHLSGNLLKHLELTTIEVSFSPAALAVNKIVIRSLTFLLLLNGISFLPLSYQAMS